MTDEDWKYPQQSYRKNGWLQVDDNPPLKSPHKIYYEEYGNPDGGPVMFLHGGPGGTCTPNFSRFLIPNVTVSFSLISAGVAKVCLT
ncbi:hypothetical protein KSD_61440 [Ktedonobacter sp. SOSP1-85]|nr:hypothetical protein KSD_61440 [Ktedonobacter sp. SOSP1-85]